MYHSALKKFKTYNVPCNGFENKDPDVTGLLFDIEKDEIPEQFYECNFLYSDLPWRQGYKVFNDRVGASGTSYEIFLTNAFLVAYKLGIPFFFTAEKSVGRTIAMAFPNQRLYVSKIFFEPHNTVCNLYSNILVSEHPTLQYCQTTSELIRQCLTLYGKGLDFACGYGNIVIEAIKLNIPVVVSDFNPNCLGYIKDVLLKKK
jgi:hypothetical protein